MTPALVDGLLPPGEWSASWAAVEAAFGTSDWRKFLLAGCRRALESLPAAGCRRVWLDGSFVTGKAHPGDIDACYVVIDLETEEFEQ